MKAQVIVKLKEGVLDPQGQAIQQLLVRSGYSQVADVKVGKLIEFELSGVEEQEGVRVLNDIADKLLANPVIESFQVRPQ